MSNVFTRLLAESGKQQEQLQPPYPVPSQSQEIFPENRRSDASTERPNDEPTLRPSDKMTNRLKDASTLRRSTERAAFDLYKDQIIAIRRIRAERELEGAQKVSLSDIAREAFDMYLKKQSKGTD